VTYNLQKDCHTRKRKLNTFFPLPLSFGLKKVQSFYLIAGHVTKQWSKKSIGVAQQPQTITSATF